MERPASGLYVVPTPIGNLGDITLRALEVLRAADCVLCEDTRRTRRLTAAYEIGARLVSCHEHNEQRRIPEVLARLENGEVVALVSDAGTPAVSDPGFRLVRAAIEGGWPVVALPGASAPVAALVASGLPTDRFAFWGFVPRKVSERRRFFLDLAGFSGTSIVFEAPGRIGATLEAAAETLGPERPCALARELTKLHEELLRGTVEEVRRALPDEPRGEITLLFGPPPASPTAAPPAEELRRRHRELLATGMDPKRAMREIARATGLRRRDVYEAVVLNADADEDRRTGTESTDGEDPR